jgi:hypothetical protein
LRAELLDRGGSGHLGVRDSCCVERTARRIVRGFAAAT